MASSMLFSGDIRVAPPCFSSDSSRVQIAASGIRNSVIAQVATQTGRILSIDASADVKGMVPFRNDVAISSSSGIAVGKKCLTNMSGSQLAAGAKGGLVFKSDNGAHVVRDYEVSDLPLEHHTIIVANDDFVVGASGSQFEVWCDEWDAPINFTHNLKITALAAGSGVLAVGDSHGVITTWYVLKKSLSKKRCEKGGYSAKNHWHANEVTALAFLSNSVISGGKEGVLRLWHLEGQTFQNVPHLGAPILHIVVSPDERWVAATMKNNSLVLIDSGDLRVKRVITAVEPREGPSLSLPQNGLCLGGHGKLSFVKRPFEAKTVHLWERNYIAEEGTSWKLVCMSASKDERTLVTSERMDFDDKTYRQVMKWWTLGNKGYTIDSIVYDAHVGKVTAIVAHPLQEQFFSVCSHGVIKTWEFLLADDRMVWQPTEEGIWREKPITAMDISVDGSLLCLAFLTHIVLWDTHTNAFVNSWLHEGRTQALDLRFFHPWGKDMLLCALFADELKVWNAVGGSKLQTLAVKSSFINISPSRKRLALAGGDVAQVYKLEQQKLTLEKEIPCSGVQSALWMTDDKVALVVGSVVEVMSLDDTILNYDRCEDEVTQKAVVHHERKEVHAADDIHQLVRGVQHCHLLEKLVIPKSTPTHLLPPGRLLLRRHLAAFARKDAHSASQAISQKDESSTPTTAASEFGDDARLLDVDACEELGPIMDFDLVHMIVSTQ
eukprot:GEMP01025015.1.p1 GENE.GEMP01025015.1~~GEMP01025015.1.p1  ORF type:complete len:720 (+),score=168.77 GEMP01025015.1:93-2252(+)